MVRYEVVLLLPHGTSKELAVRAKVSATAHAIQLVPTWMPLWALSSFVFLCIFCCSAFLSYFPALTCWKCPKDQLLSWVFQKKKSRLGMANQIEMMFGSRLLAIGYPCVFHAQALLSMDKHILSLWIWTQGCRWLYPCGTRCSLR